MKYIYRSKNESGFTLIEMAVVVVIVGIVISIMATVLPSLIQSAKIRKARAILEKADYALQGYSMANNRLPFADSGTDGDEDDGSYTGNLPYKTLGLSSADDVWGNPMKYGVYSTLTATFADATAFCTAISSAGTAAKSLSEVYTTTDESCPGTTDNISNQAYVIASGGPKDLDGVNAFFDLCNGESGAGFNAPNRIQSTTYDDLVRAFSLNELNYKNCTGGGGGGGGTTGVENTDALCSDNIDNDGDGKIDCHDQDCCGPGVSPSICPDGCPPPDDVKITTTPDPITDGIVGQTNYSHTFQATGGSGYYYWYLDSIAPVISGLSINQSSGTLYGNIHVCEGAYTVNVRVEDRHDFSRTDSDTFTLNVNNDNLSITPAPNGLGESNPDFTVDSSTFSQIFTVSGFYVGDFEWALNWVGADPVGFQVDGESGCEGKFWKSSSTTEGTYTFTLTATDSTCSANTKTTNSYTIKITPDGTGGPYSADLVAEWHMDECSWDGTAGEVKDSGDLFLDGTAQNGADTTGAGKICRAGVFDGTNDYISVNSTDELKQTAAFSIAFWVKVNANASDWVRLAGKGNSTNRNYGLWLATNGTILFQIYSNGGNGNAQTTVTVNDGNWHHVVGVYDLLTMKVYIDNVERKSINYSQTPRTSDDPFTMGYAGFHTYLNGCLDEVMLLHKALPATSETETSVDTIYNLTRSSCTGACYTEPVAEYRMENFPWNGTASEVKDSGTGASHGVAAAHGTGGALPSQTTPSGGKVCRAGVFTRVDANKGGYLDLGDPTGGYLDPYTDPWTISAWIKWDGSSGENIIYNKENLYEARVSGGYVNYAWQPHWAWDGGTSFPVTANEWTYVTTVYDGSQQILYKNGDMVYSRAQTSAMGNNSSKFLIGARGSASPSNFFGGMIDEVKIYNRALAENEIKADKNKTRDCAADSVVITTSSLSAGTVNSSYSMTIEAEGGTEPYWWTLENTLISGLSIDQNTGVLSGTINVCPGTYGDAVTIKVEDAAHRIDERKFDLTVNDGGISISPSPPGNFNCNTSDWSQEFTASGSYLGDIDWSIKWVFSDPGGIGITNEQSNSMILDKTGVSPGGEGTYYFKLTATDSLCSTNTYTNITSYSITISGDGVDAPYDYGLAAEWHMDECIWDGTSGEVADSSGNNNNGTAQNSAKTISMGKICRAGSTDATSSYVLLNPVVDLDDNSWTISAWFEWPLSSSGSGWWTLTRGTDDHQILVNRTSNLLGMYDNKTGTGFHSCGFDMSTLSNGWHHIVAVGHDSQTDYYIDGSLKGSADHKSITDIRTIGNHIGGSQNWGKFDEVFVWSRALDADDVAKVYSLSHTCPSTSCYSGSIAAWLMDENSWDGTEGEVQDSAGSANGTAQNGTTTTLDGTCYAGEFDGVNDYITIPADATALDITGDITVALWFYPNNLDSNLMTNRYNFSGREHGYHLQTKADGTVLWSSHDATTNANAACIAHSTGTVTADQWNHITVVKADGSTTVRFYVNGVSAGMDTIQKASIGYSSSHQNRWIGAGYDSYTYGGDYTFGSRQYTDGKIDEVVIWNRGLSESEIKDIYNAGRCD